MVNKSYFSVISILLHEISVIFGFDYMLSENCSATYRKHFISIPVVMILGYVKDQKPTEYHINPKYLDREAWANNENPGQMQQNAYIEQNHTLNSFHGEEKSCVIMNLTAQSNC